MKYEAMKFLLARARRKWQQNLPRIHGRDHPSGVIVGPREGKKLSLMSTYPIPQAMINDTSNFLGTPPGKKGPHYGLCLTGLLKP